MKKYYIGFAVLMAVVLASLVYAISQASAAKTDHATNQAVEDINTKLDNYTSGSGVPESLAAADIKNVPNTVKYTKLSDSQYKICVSYKTAASGFDAGWAGLLLGGAGGGFDNESLYGSDNSYFDPTIETNHKKGENCQTVTPYTYDDNSYYDTPDYSDPSSSDSSNYPDLKYSSYDCSDDDASLFSVYGQATVKSIKTTGNTSGTITFDTAGQTITDTFNSSTPSPITYKVFSSATLFCGADGEPTGSASLKVGQKVNFYMFDISSDYLDKVQL